MSIMQLVDKVNKAVEKNETTTGVYLDLSKAFDIYIIIYYSIS